MDWLISVKNFFEFYGFVSTFILTIILIVGMVLWFKGILPVLLRLGHGLAKGKIAIISSHDLLKNFVKGLYLMYLKTTSNTKTAMTR